MIACWGLAMPGSLVALYWAAASYECCAIGFMSMLAVMAVAGPIGIAAAVKLDEVYKKMPPRNGGSDRGHR